MSEKDSQKNKKFIYNEAEHKKAKRNQRRLEDIKPLVEKIHRITRQIKIVDNL